MNNSNSDFTQGSIIKKLITFMIPILGALILQAAYGAVDLMVVGEIRYYIRAFGSIYRKSGAESCYVYYCTACDGNYCSNRKVHRRKERGADRLFDRRSNYVSSAFCSNGMLLASDFIAYAGA